MDQSQYVIGIDLGGTNIKSVAVNLSGEILDYEKAPTDDANSGWLEAIRALISHMKNTLGAVPQRIGFAAPGLVSADQRSIYTVHGKLAGLIGVDWTNELNSPHPVYVLNDAQAALLGETHVGAAIGARNAILITLGTGVGGAILTNGQLLRGHLGWAGHLGHICLNPEGHRNATGVPGSLEEAIGDYSLLERTSGTYSSTSDLVAAYQQDEPMAVEVWLKSVYYLACGITSLINTLDPELIIIGGGIASAGSALFDPLNKYLDQLEWRPHGVRVPLIQATLGDSAGAIGAAFHALDNLS